MAGRRATLSFALLQIALGLALLAGLWFAWPAWRLGAITEQVRKRYPGVPLFSTADLSTWLGNADNSKPLIVDVRSQDEYDVSHLISAIHVDAAADLTAVRLPEDHHRVIITYSGTSEHAAAYATRLQEAGYSRVFALEGGIIRWVNEGRALTDGKSSVTRVRPSDKKEANLLSSRHRADLPAAP